MSADGQAAEQGQDRRGGEASDGGHPPQKGTAEESRPAADDGLFRTGDTGPGAKEGRAAAGGAEARIARESRAAFSLHDASTYIGGTVGAVNFLLGGGPRLLAGPLPDDELTRLRRRFSKPPGYDDLKRRLRDDHLVVLSGQPGTGRMYTALSLLDDLALGKVSRLDPGSDLTALGDEGNPVEDAHGYALEPLDGRLPAELHLDRLCRLLADRGSFAVLLTVPGAGDQASGQDRYHHAHEPAATEGVLDAQVRAELEEHGGGDGQGGPGAAESLPAAALRVAAAPEIRGALGLESLLPAEAARLAGLAARHVTGGLPLPRLTAECRTFAAEQVRQWFAGGARAETLPALRDAAYRIALAVLGNSSFNSVAEAAELLVWELSVTVEPERVIGRPLLSDGLEARLASARARTQLRDLPVVGGADIPVRTVRFRGAALAPAVLAHLWVHHHNMRGPVLRWLGSLCEDPRADVWTRAAVAAGELCRHDCAHTVSELLGPMAASTQARRGLFVATALESVLDDPQVGGALRALVKQWGESDDGDLRWTAAAVLSRGTATATLAQALGALGRIGTWEDGRLRVAAADGVVHLLGSAPVAEPLVRMRGWLDDSRREFQYLGLVAAVLLADFRVEDVWNPAPELTGREKWPLALAITATRTELGPTVAGLLWTALNTGPSYKVALDAVADWLRTCHNTPWEGELLRFLGLLTLTQDDRNRLLSLIKELSEDPDEPLGQEHTRRLWQAVQEAGNR
ncbi:hypothetical protein SAMN05216251_105113 [Actinacidiphila alni]|uniref:Uncharacterized protein n=1 Tax=Actinacidiphila alni TaxID=380248 RepID=A0A1I2D780_9ACTN|nr:hypothetical protein [Actinacidiphila alni]SFE76396.1 hypothetical protein SAMN05216251_105113 [Actinacidiphila alni]